jgi:hypothetical protein
MMTDFQRELERFERVQRAHWRFFDYLPAIFILLVFLAGRG